MKVMQRTLRFHRFFGTMVGLLPSLLSLSGTFLPALEVSSECLLTGLGLGGTAAASSAILITTGTRRTVFCSVARFTTVEAQAGTGTRGPLHSGGGGGGGGAHRRRRASKKMSGANTSSSSKRAKQASKASWRVPMYQMSKWSVLRHARQGQVVKSWANKDMRQVPSREINRETRNRTNGIINSEGVHRAGEETRDPWRRLLYRETASTHHGKLYWKYCVATPTDILSRCRHVGCVVICPPDQHLGQRIEHMGRTLRIIHLVGAELHGLLPGAQVQKSLPRQVQK